MPSLSLRRLQQFEYEFHKSILRRRAFPRQLKELLPRTEEGGWAGKSTGGYEIW